MGNSGIHWIDVTFDCCVRLLYDVAAMIGITYEEINVWLFVIIGPSALLASISLDIYYLRRNARLKQKPHSPASTNPFLEAYERPTPPSL